MKKYSIIFSILLVFILMGASCVCAAEIDNSTPDILENSNITLSQGDNIDLNYENEVLENNNDLLEDSTVEIGSDDELILQDSNNDADNDLEIISTDSVDVDENEPDDILGNVNVDSELSDSVSSLPDLAVDFFTLEHLNEFLYYMQITDMNVKKQYKEHLSAIYQTDVPLQHSNVLRLCRNIDTISNKLILKIDSGKDIVIDGDGHTINLAGSSKHDHYFVVKSGKVTFKNIKFENGYNKDGDNGGAISFEGSALGSVINCVFTNCWAEDDGGAIADRSDNTLTIINSTFIGNEAGDCAGAVDCAGKLILRNCTFISNVAHDKGGAVYSSTNLLIDGCTFTGNKVGESSDKGGAIYANNLEFTTAPSLFENNRANDGGAIYANKIIGDIVNATFKNNYAKWNGGAFYLTKEFSLNFLFCLFEGNTADNGGGVLWRSDDGLTTFKSCVFIGNKATQRAGVIFDTDDLYMQNNIFVNNNAGNDGKIAYITHDDYKVIINGNWIDKDLQSNFYVYRNQYYHDNDPAEFVFNYYPDYRSVKVELSFKTKSGKNLEYPLNLLKDYISFNSVNGIDGKFESVVVDGDKVIATYIPNRAGAIDFELNFYGVKSRHSFNVITFDPQMSFHVDDAIPGDINYAFVDVYFNESVNDKVDIEFNGVTYTFDVINGHASGLIPLYDVSVGNHTMQAHFDGYLFFNPDHRSASFKIVEDYDPLTWSFTTLQNFINHYDVSGYYKDGVLKLPSNITFSMNNDGLLTGGVVVSKDNLVIDGNGITINGLLHSRIFDIQACNVTLKNFIFINGQSAENAGAIFFHEPGLIDKCTFTNNTAHNGGAVYFANGGTVKNSIFNNNSVYMNGGAIFSTGAELYLDACEFYYNYAKFGSAVYADTLVDVRNSIFLKNKADAKEMDFDSEDNKPVVRFIGGNTYINAIYAKNNKISFDNVTYWFAKEVNSDDVEPEFYSAPGIKIVLIIEDYMEHGKIERNLTTDMDNAIYIDLSNLEDKIYIFEAYHLDDDYYTPISINDTFYIFRQSSSVTINVPDGADITYPNDKIGFTIVKRTDNVKVVITDKNGNIVLEKDNVEEDYVLINDLPYSDDYYNITVYNLGNYNIRTSMDSKLFKLSKASSRISIDLVSDFIYGSDLEVLINGSNLTSFNLFIYNEDNALVYSQAGIVDTHISVPTLPTSPTLPILPIGKYRITVVNVGDDNHLESEDSLVFIINPYSVEASIEANTVVLGEETIFTVKSSEARNYTINVNGTILTLSFNTPGTKNISISLPSMGTYNAVLSPADPNCVISGINHVSFNVLKGSNHVSVSAENVTYRDIQEIHVYAEHDGLYNIVVNGSSGTLYSGVVKVENGIGHYRVFLNAGNYSIFVTSDDPNYNSNVAIGYLTISKSRYDVSLRYALNRIDPRDVEIFVNASVKGYYNISVNGQMKSIYTIGCPFSTTYRLDPGVYVATCDFEDPNYETFITNITIEVPEVNREVNLMVLAITDNNAQILVDSNLDGICLVTLNGTLYPVNVVDGKGNLTVPINTNGLTVGMIPENGNLLTSYKVKTIGFTKKETPIDNKNIVTKENPLKVKGKTVKVKFSKLKKKTQKLKVSKIVKFIKKGQGSLTYKKVKGNKKISINKKTGKVTIKKGLKKGTYKVKMKIKAKGNANYKASSFKTVTFKIKIK